MRKRLAAGLKLGPALCLLLALLPAARAQGLAGDAAPVAIKLDEYVNLFSSCNAGAHLDNFAIELQNRPGVNGHIVVYGPGGAHDGFGRRAADVTKDYLVNVRGLAESRLTAVYGGRHRDGRELLTELWLVPEGAEPPAEVGREGDAAPFEGKFAEVGLWEGFGTDIVGSWGSVREVTLVGFSDLLRRQPETRAYIVAFHDAGSAPGAWRRVTGDAVELLGRQGVGPGRVEVIFGGYRKEAVAELWVLPRGALPPAVASARERRPKEAVKVGMFEQFELKQGRAARRAFEGFAQVLKTDREVNAYVLVYLPFAGPQENDGGEAQPGAGDGDVPAPGPAEPPDINLAQLAEQWKHDLKKQYGIGEQRLVVVLVAPRESWNADRLETWIVPPGAAAPDPFSGEAEQVSRQRKTN